MCSLENYAKTFCNYRLTNLIAGLKKTRNLDESFTHGFHISSQDLLSPYFFFCFFSLVQGGTLCSVAPRPKDIKAA